MWKHNEHNSVIHVTSLISHNLRNVVYYKAGERCWVWHTPTCNKICSNTWVVIQEGKAHLFTSSLSTLHEQVYPVEQYMICASIFTILHLKLSWDSFPRAYPWKSLPLMSKMLGLTALNKILPNPSSHCLHQYLYHITVEMMSAFEATHTHIPIYIRESITFPDTGWQHQHHHRRHQITYSCPLSPTNSLTSSRP